MTDEAPIRGDTTGRFLEQDHSSLGKLFAELQSVFIERSPGSSFDLLDLIWARLAIHIRAEHLCLFPALLSAPAQKLTGRSGAPSLEEVRDAVAQLRSDHDFFMHELASAVNTLRPLKDAKDLPPPELEAVRSKVDAVYARLEEHNRIEEEKVYRWIELVLTEEERASLFARIRLEFEKQPTRFQQRDMYPNA